MGLFLHAIFIVLILLCSMAVYGAFFKNWGERHFNMTRRVRLIVFFTPRTLPAYVVYYKILVILNLLIVAGLYVLNILNAH